MAIDPGFETKACTKYEALLEDYLEGALDAVESRAAEAHWRDCAGCRAALDQASASIRMLRFVGPSDGPGPAFARTVMARIRAAGLVLDTDSYPNMLQRLEASTKPEATFRHTARELLALSAWRANDVTAARQWLDMIASDGETPSAMRSRAEALQALLPPVAKS